MRTAPLLLALGPVVASAGECMATGLDRMVVTATRTEQTLEQAPATVAVRDIARLRDNGVISGTDEFRGVTGVFFRRGEGDDDELPYVSIRGSTRTERFLTPPDGRRQVSASNGIVLRSSHNLDLSLQLADQVWLDGQGSVQAGTPDELAAQDAFGRAFNTTEVTFPVTRCRFELVDAAPEPAFAAKPRLPKNF